MTGTCAAVLLSVVDVTDLHLRKIFVCQAVHSPVSILCWYFTSSFLFSFSPPSTLRCRYGDYYADMFKEEGYDGADELLTLTADVLSDLGVKRGHRKPILEAVDQMR